MAKRTQAMTTHTFRIELAQRYKQGNKKQPSPPRLADAARLVSNASGLSIPIALLCINDNKPFRAEFRKMVQAGPNLNDAGYKVLVVTGKEIGADVHRDTRPMTVAERKRKSRASQ